MEVVINKQWGGFELSPIALSVFYKKKGIDVTFYTDRDSVRGSKLRRIPNTEASDLNCYAFNKDFGEETDWSKVKDEAFLSKSNMDRADQDLVETVRELGEKANTCFSFLKIVSIPDGTQYAIDDYDGMESIHEVHKTWD